MTETEQKQTSERIDAYHKYIHKNVDKAYKISQEARKQGFDPIDKVEIPLAKNMAERVEGLISAIAPQIAKSGISERIQELEKKFGTLDWRVALTIAAEISEEKFCKFKDQKEKMEVGIRVGFAYLTLGTVSSPLEGFVGLKFKKRKDNKEYFALQYSGPIRSAGGTAAAVSVILADFMRKKHGYDVYDPDETETKRMITELYDYHDRITNLQYRPSEEEVTFLWKNIPVQIDGDPSEKIEVSNYKDLKRIESNRIRNGPCLVLGECVAQKAPKIWKQLKVWGKDFDLEHWSFLGEFIDLQKKIKAHGTEKKSDEKITKNFTYISDLVAGRPVLAMPIQNGGFRLRYGRCRVSGYSACCISPITSFVLNNYIAACTQLKLERPGKATSLSFCDTIEGPIVKLKDNSIVKPTLAEAKLLKDDVIEIIYLGDILVNYGDFFNRAHVLIPPGYCEEWWILEVEKAVKEKYNDLDLTRLAKDLETNKETIENIFKDPLRVIPKSDLAIKISKFLDVPFHPAHTFFWKSITYTQLLELINTIEKSKLIKEENIIKKLILPLGNSKRSLELLGIPHKIIQNEFVVIEKDLANSFCYQLGIQEEIDLKKIKPRIKDKPILEIINDLSKITIKDKEGIFIGARMGRPEKAKIRKLKGSPHVLFPVGEEGGRLRCFQSSLEAKKIRSDFSIFHCNHCSNTTVTSKCEICNSKTKRKYSCKICGLIDEKECKVHGPAYPYKKIELAINDYFKNTLKQIKYSNYPDLIKGVKGTSNKEHIPENLAKGILRANHEIYVNKDGTTRYDMTQVPITHFKAKEIGTKIEKLIELGYTNDIDGNPLVNEQQILELYPQDVVLPNCPDSPDEGAAKILFRITKFIDEMLKKLYGLKPFYNLKNESDIVGQLVMALAPHTSAGIVARIIGFSQTQGFYAHPMLHAATRRDCFTHDTFIPLFIDGKWQIREIGNIVENFNPKKIIDKFGTKEIKLKNIKTINVKDLIQVNNFTKHTKQPIIKIKTKLGRTFKTTLNHKHIVFIEGKEEIKTSKDLKIGDTFGIPYNIKIPKKDIKLLDLFDLFKKEEWIMVKNVNKICKNIKKYAKSYFKNKDYRNYYNRDSYPIKFIDYLKNTNKIKDTIKLKLSSKQDIVKIPSKIPLSKEFLQLIGLYVAEGYSRKVDKMLYQVYISAENKEIRLFINKNMRKIFGLSISENKKDRMTYSSRILYSLFTSVLECGSIAKEKRIPSLFLNLPNNKLGHVLSGYLEGDGSVSKGDLRVSFDTTSPGLLRDIDFIFAQMGIFVKNYTYTKEPGKLLRDFYIKKNRPIPKFTITKGTIQSVFINKFSKYIDFMSSKKRNILKYILNNRKPRNVDYKYNTNLVFDSIVSIENLKPQQSYCLNVQGNKVIANSILTKQCDGDESSIFLLVDAFINFSRKYLSNTRGTTQDSPLVLTSILIPSEVDDMAFDLDVVKRYPLEFYEACLAYKNPWEVKMDQINNRLNTPNQYENMGFTHDVNNINDGVLCSAYKTLPSMQEKLSGQMDLATKIRAVDDSEVAKLVIEKHFIRDIRGNLRKFSTQEFRCVGCNEKYRRPPLVGRCTKCKGKIIFTISEGSIVKYLGPAMSLAKTYKVKPYLTQSLDLTQRMVEGIFGKEKDKQVGLGHWFG